MQRLVDPEHRHGSAVRLRVPLETRDVVEELHGTDACQGTPETPRKSDDGGCRWCAVPALPNGLQSAAAQQNLKRDLVDVEGSQFSRRDDATRLCESCQHRSWQNPRAVRRTAVTISQSEHRPILVRLSG
ncbi:hypothetical protein GCM10009766_15090 [Microcella frigidaquae]